MNLTRRLFPKSKLFRYFVTIAVLATILIIELNDISMRISGVKTNASAEESENTSCKQAAVLKSSSGSLPKLPPLRFYMDALSLKSPRRNDSFDPQMNATELTAYMSLLWGFLDLCEKHKIEVIIFYGTLLGSYRYHGIIPWDDDVDLLIKESDMIFLKDLMLNSSNGMRVVDDSCWRLYNQTACFKKVHGRKKWCWPFIDVASYRINGSVVHLLGGLSNFKYPMRLIFPTHKRPFMGRWVSSPRDALGCLGFDYKLTDNCLSLQFSHRLYKKLARKASTINCSSLHESYPFVTRTLDPNAVGLGNASGVFETLYDLEGRPLYTVLVEEPILDKK